MFTQGDPAAAYAASQAPEDDHPAPARRSGRLTMMAMIGTFFQDDLSGLRMRVIGPFRQRRRYELPQSLSSSHKVTAEYKYTRYYYLTPMLSLFFCFRIQGFHSLPRLSPIIIVYIYIVEFIFKDFVYSIYRERTWTQRLSVVFIN